MNNKENNTSVMKKESKNTPKLTFISRETGEPLHKIQLNEKIIAFFSLNYENDEMVEVMGKDTWHSMLSLSRHDMKSQLEGLVKLQWLEQTNEEAVIALKFAHEVTTFIDQQVSVFRDNVNISQ